MDFFSNEALRRIVLILVSLGVSFFLSLVLAPFFIKLLYRFKIVKQIREETCDGHDAKIFKNLHSCKCGTPTMGGILIWGVTLVVILGTIILNYFDLIKYSLWNRQETYLPVFTLISVAILGAIDDIFNLRKKDGVKGMTVKPKMFWLIIFAVIGALWFYFKLDWNTRAIWLPFFEEVNIGYFIIPLFIFVIISSANAVNFTDGLDGLAGGLLIMAFLAFGIISYAQGLFILAAFCAVVCGALMGFLWFNVPPANFFMGDTGSLALGATLGVIAMLTNSVFVLPLIGFVFVLEGFSSLIQILSKKFFGVKIFHIAPLHHHFEYLGWPETTITLRFWIIGGFIAVFGIIIRFI